MIASTLGGSVGQRCPLFAGGLTALCPGIVIGERIPFGRVQRRAGGHGSSFGELDVDRAALAPAAGRLTAAPGASSAILLEHGGSDRSSITMFVMALTAKKLDVHVGDLVEIEGRAYDVVPDKEGGVTLEPAITKTVVELRAARGGRPLTGAEFEELFGGLPSDGEGSSVPAGRGRPPRLRVMIDPDV
jgi:hypothetical protein